MCQEKQLKNEPVIPCCIILLQKNLQNNNEPRPQLKEYNDIRPQALLYVVQMATQQQQMEKPMETSATSNLTHLQVFEAYYPRIHMTLASECSTTATALWGKDLISDDLNDKIVDRSGLAASNSEMARAMLNTVHRGLKQEDDDRQDKWKDFIDALKQESIWIPKAEKLGKGLYTSWL